MLGQPRTTQARARKVASAEGALRGDIVRLASRFGRYGYRRVTDMLRIEGWGVHHKRVERIWRQEGLKVPERQPKARSAVAQRRIVHPAEAAVPGPRLVVRLRGLEDPRGRALKLLTVLDEHTRECLAIVVARKIRSHDVLEVLADLFVRHGPPEYLRSDNGTGVHREARAAVVGARGRRDALYRAGQPVGERLQRELQRQAQDELLNGEIFYSLAEAAVLVEQWRRGVQYRPTPQRLRRLSPGP